MVFLFRCSDLKDYSRQASFGQPVAPFFVVRIDRGGRHDVRWWLQAG